MSGGVTAIRENGLNLVLKVTEEGDVRLLHFHSSPYEPGRVREGQEAAFRLVEVQFAGEDQDDHHGSKTTGTLPGKRLRLREIRDTRNERGRRVEIEQADARTGAIVTSRVQFFDGLRAAEWSTAVENRSPSGTPVGLTYVSSFALTGLTQSALADWDEALRLKIPSNTWYGEFQWKDYRPSDLGFYKVFHYSTNRVSVSSTGTWCSQERLPMAYLENAESGEGWYFSILHNGSWHWEVSDSRDALYLHVSGPNEAENHWYRELAAGERFESVPVAVAATQRGFTDAVAEITRYRRRVRRPNRDNERLPIIFNDFMNCLSGDPTEEKLLPLIDAAAEAGCEYFTIDAGWYADGPWWTRVGEWEPAAYRFPHGLEFVTARIRERGMVPGLWLEPEVIGVECPVAARLPDDFFFMRHGRRVIDHGRYQLDFRHPGVVRFVDGIVDRLVRRYGAGYIKMDYNINAGIGTETRADSPGDGLLEHNRAFLRWLDSLFVRYPDLIVESCGSGGMRVSDAMLSRLSIQSSSDQTDYLDYAAISAAAPAAVTPEQNAVWSYPLAGAGPEQTAFNMVNAMLSRVHQSGHLARLSPESLRYVREALAYYREIRDQIPQSFPFWPLGLPAIGGGSVAVGYWNQAFAHVAVWRCGAADETLQIPLDGLPRAAASVQLVYPADLPCGYRFHRVANVLTVRQPPRSARLFRVDYQPGQEGVGDEA